MFHYSMCFILYSGSSCLFNLKFNSKAICAVCCASVQEQIQVSRISRPWILACGCGPATRCVATHLRRDVLNSLRCIKIACDALRYIFQHVGNLSPDFGISQLFIVRDNYHRSNDHRRR